MKRLILLFCIAITSCGNTGSQQKKMNLNNDPFVHFELLGDRGEDQMGDSSYIFVLQSTFRSDSSTAIIVRNIQHSADICNGGTDTNHVGYPYIRYKQFQDSPKRGNTWVFVSQRLIPTQTVQVEAWMDSVALLFPNQTPDPVAGTHPLTIYKKKWHSTLIPPL